FLGIADEDFLLRKLSNTVFIMPEVEGDIPTEIVVADGNARNLAVDTTGAERADVVTDARIARRKRYRPRKQQVLRLAIKEVELGAQPVVEERHVPPEIQVHVSFPLPLGCRQIGW